MTRTFNRIAASALFALAAGAFLPAHAAANTADLAGAVQSALDSSMGRQEGTRSQCEQGGSGNAVESACHGGSLCCGTVFSAMG